MSEEAGGGFLRTPRLGSDSRHLGNERRRPVAFLHHRRGQSRHFPGVFPNFFENIRVK
jgi:hypothetical protein